MLFFVFNIHLCIWILLTLHKEYAYTKLGLLSLCFRSHRPCEELGRRGLRGDWRGLWRGPRVSRSVQCTIVSLLLNLSVWLYVMLFSAASLLQISSWILISLGWNIIKICKYVVRKPSSAFSIKDTRFVLITRYHENKYCYIYLFQLPTDQVVYFSCPSTY